MAHYGENLGKWWEDVLAGMPSEDFAKLAAAYLALEKRMGETGRSGDVSYDGILTAAVWSKLFSHLDETDPTELEKRAGKIATGIPDLYMPYTTVSVDQTESPTPVTDSEKRSVIWPEPEESSYKHFVWQTPAEAPTESPTPVTDSEKRSAEVASDIVTGKILKPDLPRIRDAIDKVEATKTGRDAADHAIGHSISRNRK